MRPFIHALPPERAHRAGIVALASGLLPLRAPVASPLLATQLAGLSLPNPIGLAAGFDKNAETLPHVFKAGFGFVECGTVTPRAQAGNPQPRLFRLPQHRAVINRLGFNNEGLEAFVPRLMRHSASGVVGANIGKNKDSEDAVADYVTAMQAVYAHASYITINISSPNTAGLRDLQAIDPLRQLHDAVREVRERLVAQGQARKPVFVKLAPDLDADPLDAIARWALADGCDGLIMGNTTIDHSAVAGHPLADQQGGLSGRPLFEHATRKLAALYRATSGKVPLIGVGGIASADDAYQKIRAGATAIQLYTALVYDGLGLVARIHDGLVLRLKRDGFAHISEAVGKDA